MITRTVISTRATDSATPVAFRICITPASFASPTLLSWVCYWRFLCSFFRWLWLWFVIIACCSIHICEGATEAIDTTISRLVEFLIYYSLYRQIVRVSISRMIPTITIYLTSLYLSCCSTSRVILIQDDWRIVRESVKRARLRAEIALHQINGNFEIKQRKFDFDVFTELLKAE